MIYTFAENRSVHQFNRRFIQFLSGSIKKRFFFALNLTGFVANQQSDRSDRPIWSGFQNTAPICLSGSRLGLGLGFCVPRNKSETTFLVDYIYYIGPICLSGLGLGFCVPRKKSETTFLVDYIYYILRDQS